MSVRLWLGIAECWQCGAAIELSDEQEREARRLVQRASSPAPPSPPSPPPSAPPPLPSNPPSTRVAAVAPERAPAPSPSPSPAPQRPRRATLRRRRRSLASDWLRDMPAWLVSLLLHMFLLLLLGLLKVYEETDAPFITLSTTVSRQPSTGEMTVAIDEQDEVAFNLPIPDNIDLENKQLRETLVAANQDARELQLNPEMTLPNLPTVEQIKKLASSADPVRRSLAIRDPRLRVEVMRREGGTTLTEAAVSRGLRWLARQQQRDGRWTHGAGGFDTANTALALLPFLGAGQTPHAGLYKDHVASGLRWLRAQQKPDGDLRGGTSQHPGMYAHGIASIVLCDAFALTGDESLREPARKALDFIVAAQSDSGGWRYMPRQDADLSVVGWQLMALQSGRMAGLDVPAETLELADQYLDTVAHDDGAKYSYQRQGSESRPTATMTAEGLLCRMYLGWKKDTPGLVRGVEWLADSHLPQRREANIYYWYYATQVFHHYGGEPWERWNRRMRDLLVEAQVTQGPHAGSWHPEGDRWGNTGGRIFMTSLAVCSLEVYYRHAPIYRQLKLD